MCRALRVLCAAPDEGSLQALKRAAVSTGWELVGGATSAEQALDQIGEWEPDVLVFFGTLAVDLAAHAKEIRPAMLTIVIGPGDGDLHVTAVADVKEVIAGGGRSPGPVR